MQTSTEISKQAAVVSAGAVQRGRASGEESEAPLRFILWEWGLGG